jgi:hypothetical protein
MKKIILFCLLLLCSFFKSYALTYQYDPAWAESNAEYNTVDAYRAIVLGLSPSQMLSMTLKVEIQNANLSYNGQITLGSVFYYNASDVVFSVKYTTPNTQAIVKVSWIDNATYSIVYNTHTWKINVGAVPTPTTLSISGPGQIELNGTATYTASFSNHSSSTSYNWSSTNGKLSIISGQGTNTVTVQATSLGTEQLKVSTGGLNVTKSINIFSNTTNIVGQTITSNVNFSNLFINVSNTTITNNATVNITAEELVTISPSFLAQQGTTVTIKAVGSGGLRSSNSVEDTDMITDIAEIPIKKTSEILSQNTPNPFSDRTKISYVISEEAKYSYINIYNLQGKIVKHVDINEIGKGEIYIESTGLASGMYIYSLFVDGIRKDTKRMIVK